MESGTKLGHYEILSALGKGGMGEVWRATDTKLGREVAIKTLPEEFAQDADRLSRFEREAKLLASLNHPNIAAIYGLEESNGTRFLVLELVEGDTLADQIKREPIPVEESLKLALQIAEALESAHEKGVIHRDLKPANIKVTPEGQVKVLDFGLAKALSGEESNLNLSMSPTLSMAATQQGVILGTAAYMSPEQARGVEVDKRADIWAFGAVVFEMLTGRQAFQGELMSDVMASVLKSSPDYQGLPTTIHPRLKDLLRRCMEKDSKNRYRDIGDVRYELQQVATDPGGSDIERSPQAIPATAQSKLSWVAVTAMVTGMFVGLAVWNLRPSPEPDIVSRFSHVLPEGQEFTSPFTQVVTVSPDGSSIVYVADNQLYLRMMGSLESSPITGTDEVPFGPFFSPDGQWIGYWTNAGSQLRKVPVSGGTPVSIAVSNIPFGRPVWEADDTIVWAEAEGLFRVSANGGTPDILVPSGTEAIAYPQMLPDGESVLFTLATTGGDTQIAVQSLRSGERKTLFPGAHSRYLSTGHIVYGLDDVLFAVPFDLATLEETGGAAAVFEGVNQDSSLSSGASFAVSDSGSLAWIPGIAGSINRILAIVGRDGSVQELNAPPKQYLSPRVSPDGGKLVVHSVEDGGDTLWVYDLADDRAIEQLTFTGDNQFPIWTPDSQNITFASDRGGARSIYSMPADGSGVAERLTMAEEGSSHWPGSWSPEGNTLVFAVEREQITDWEIWTSTADGETENLYDVAGEVYMAPELSPDGQWLAFASGPNAGQADVYVEPFPPTGGGRRRISQGGGRGIWPVWSPAGNELFYRPTTGGGAALRLVSVDIVTEPSFSTGNEQALPVEDFVIVAFYRGYDVTPDGERLLMVFPEGRDESDERVRPQINVVLNWIEELKERVPVP